ncbi:MAG: LysR family transcriptional regulator substrate-binding protein [Verrucomicrobiota bacterium]
MKTPGDCRTDLVFSEKPLWDGRFEFFGLFSDTFHIIVSPAHRWAIEGSVAAAEFPTAPFVLHRSLGDSQRMIAEYLADKNVVLNTAAEMDSLDAIKDFVRQADVLTILPRWAVRRELMDGSLVALPLGRKTVAQTWGFTHWRHRPLNHSEASVLELCRNVLEAVTDKVTTPLQNGSIAARSAGVPP